MRKEAKELARLLEKQHGLQVGYDGRDHYVVRDPKQDYKVVARFASTPSTPRWRENAVQDLIRAGSLDRDPYKAGGTMTNTATAEKPSQTNLDVGAALRAHTQRSKYVKDEVNRLFAELGHIDGIVGTLSSGLPTRFVERAHALAAENGETRSRDALMTALWQLRNDRRVGVGSLDLFEKVIYEWDNNINRPEKRTESSDKRPAGTYKSTLAKPDVFKCDECGLTFENAHGLSVHMVSHRSEVCGICGQSVGLNGLGRHMQAHRNNGELGAGVTTAQAQKRKDVTKMAGNALQTKLDRNKRAEALRDRLAPLVTTNEIRKIAELVADDPDNGLISGDKQKKAASLMPSLLRLATGQAGRVFDHVLDRTERALDKWDAEHGATPEPVKQAEPGPSELVQPLPAEKVAERVAERLVTAKDDQRLAVLQLVAKSDGSEEAIKAAMLLLKLT